MVENDMVNLESTQASRDSLAFGWCDLGSSRASEGTKTALGRSLRSEGPGYLAMLAFLSAYLLNVAGAGHIVPAVLNFTGAAVGAVYLLGKHAFPSVISNLLWVAITLVGLFIERSI
jgi:hypothetical protein